MVKKLEQIRTWRSVILIKIKSINIKVCTKVPDHKEGTLYTSKIECMFQISNPTSRQMSLSLPAVKGRLHHLNNRDTNMHCFQDSSKSLATIFYIAEEGNISLLKDHDKSPTNDSANHRYSQEARCNRIFCSGHDLFRHHCALLTSRESSISISNTRPAS
jgi:hypothetical protein